MATIEENLQTLKDSTDAIKQAIIDKGGDVSGDITTWAGAINEIENNSGTSEPQYIFTGDINKTGTYMSIKGVLNQIPNTGINRLMVMMWGYTLMYTSTLVRNIEEYIDIILDMSGLDVDDPIYQSKPSLCILSQQTNYEFTTIPVTFRSSGTEPA